MKTPKRAVVSKKITDSQVVDAQRWLAFIEASGTPYENLTEEWHSFFSQQAEISSASVELVKLIDKAISKDLENVK
jgi:hypothetical protein